MHAVVYTSAYLELNPMHLQNTSKVNSFVYYYGEKMREAMTMALTSPKNDGLYMPSCLSHTGEHM